MSSALLAAMLTSCAYDWTLGNNDSGAVDSASAIDSAAADTGTSDAAAPDTTAPDTLTPDTITPVDTAPSCTALSVQLENARVASKRCVSTAGACSKSVLNECKCPSTVGDDTKPESGAFVKAVNDFLAAKCTPSCGTACGALTPGLCIVNDAGGTSCSGP